jgi:outer membrane protein assembly factor BamB
MRVTRFLLAASLATLALLAPAADWPQWGGGPTRNPVSLEKGLSLDFLFPKTDYQTGKVTQPARGIAWTARVGDQTVVPPVVADGLVWVCASASDPNDDKIRDWDGGVLMCLRESDGKLLWKHRTPRIGNFVSDFPRSALGSAPLVEGDRLYYVNNRHEVVCLDVAPLKKGTGEPKEVWKLDMPGKLGVFPHLPLMQRGFAASVAGYNDRLFVVTHNGVDETHVNIPAPNAPSLVCLEKATGKVLWKDNSPGKSILHCQISSPLVAEINGKAQVIVGQGDGWLRSFEADTGKLIWRCDLNPKDSVYELGGNGDRNYVVATPLQYENRVYVATGQEVEHGPGPAALYCIDPTKRGDVSRELDAGPKRGKPNPNSAIIWYTPKDVPADAPRIEVGKKKRDLLRSRDSFFCRSVSGCVAHDGLLYAADVMGFVYCFDAKTGKLYWIEDLKASARGQLLWVDGRVLVVSDNELFAFAHGKEKKQLAKIEGERSFYAGPVFANGTLYLTTDSTLYAVRAGKK